MARAKKTTTKKTPPAAADTDRAPESAPDAEPTQPSASDDEGRRMGDARDKKRDNFATGKSQSGRSFKVSWAGENIDVFIKDDSNGEEVSSPRVYATCSECSGSQRLGAVGPNRWSMVCCGHKTLVVCESAQ